MTRCGWIYQRIFKHALDIILSSLALVLFSPVLLLVGILVRAWLGQPVLFKQQRPGLNERGFTLYKFRTMTDAVDERGQLLPDAQRMTKFGRFLRSTSLDELPELINILKGEMSFVGPRPQLFRDAVFMTDEERKRHSVKPGLTGLAQVGGRNAITWERKFALDLQYISEISFSLDLLILVRTIATVIVRDGVSAEGLETSEDLGEYLLRTGKIDVETFRQKIRTQS